MIFKISTRKKDNSIQAIISYRFENEKKWRTKSKQGFDKERDAKKWANDHVLELQEITKNKNIDPATMDTTFKNAIDMFLSFKKRRVKPNSYRTYSYIALSLEPYHNHKIKDMSILEFQKIADEQKSYGTIFLRSFFKWLKKNENQ